MARDARLAGTRIPIEAVWHAGQGMPPQGLGGSAPPGAPAQVAAPGAMPLGSAGPPAGSQLQPPVASGAMPPQPHAQQQLQQQPASGAVGGLPGSPAPPQPPGALPGPAGQQVTFPSSRLLSFIARVLWAAAHHDCLQTACGHCSVLV